MPSRIVIFVHCLSVPPGVRTSTKDRLLHREIPGWGAMQRTGGVGDLGLLLIADQLQMDSPWIRSAGDIKAYYRDSEQLVDELRRAGRIAKADRGPTVAQAWERITELVGEGLRGFGPWLKAQHAAARQWTAEEAIIQRFWDATRGDQPTWRDTLHEARLSTARHAHRNQEQAITALMTLLEWQSDGDLDSGMVREAIGRELLHIHAACVVAAEGQAIPHDWSDFQPLYARLVASPAKPALSIRLPGLLADPPERVAALLAGSAPDIARRLVADALADGDATTADIEREVLRAVPRDIRAPHIYRQVSFYRYDQQYASRIGLHEGGFLAMSTWRLAGESHSR